MPPAPLTPNETERIEALYSLHLLDSAPEKEFDELVEVASRICGTPMSLITLVDKNRQWFKAKKGFEDAETSRDTSFCSHTILGDTMMEVQDATRDQRFVDNPYVTDDPNIRFYAGVPLVSATGYNIGALCVLDTKPRKLSKDQVYLLDVLSRQIIKLFDLRLQNLQIADQRTIMENQKNHLQELSEIQNKIISIVAHDVRSPVASLRNVIDLKKRDDITAEEMNEFMDMLSKQLDGTMSLLSNLVEWGGILIKKSATKWKSINIHDLVNAVFKDLEIAALVKENRLINNIPATIIVWADDNMLKFIIRNILSNAIKFTDKGEISIGARQEKIRMRISIADTGIGMTEELKNNLFKPNRTSSRKGTKMEEGSGLGLILTKEFAESLGSELVVESTPHVGTTISFTVPLP